MTQRFPNPPAAGCRIPIFSIDPPDNKVLLEYVFVDETRLYFQTKTRIVHEEPKTHKDCPEWDHFGITDLETNEPMQEFILRPVAMYNDPFRKGKNKLVLCECLDSQSCPAGINMRAPCANIMRQVEHEEPWFGIEQEYTILNNNGCSLGLENVAVSEFKPDCRYMYKIGMADSAAFERQVAEVHLNACLNAGLNMYGMNREVYPSMWEFQTGPTQGIDAVDELQMARYILLRLAEMFGVRVSFETYPTTSKCFSQFLHINFSTKNMREEGGLIHIKECIQNLAKVPNELLMKFFDRENGQTTDRLDGIDFTPDGRIFSSSLNGDKVDCSVRVTSLVARKGKGWLEDRRPACDCDIYTAIGAFTKAALMEYKVTEWESDKL